MKVSPSILSADFSNLEADVKSISSSDMIHIDVMDGVFVPNISFGAPIVSAIRKKTDLILDTHLMIIDPIRYIDDFIKAGSDLITIHYESKNVITALRKIRHSGIKAGLSIKPGTPVKAVTELLPFCDLVLVMTVEPGFGGQELIESCLDKNGELVKLREDNHWNFLIENDGGINDSTIDMVIRSGADIAVMGSAVFSIDRDERNKYIENIKNKG